jgi:nicotinate-nucleotide adenylyltransferase
VRRDDHAYTVDLLRSGGFDPGSTVFLVGADELADLPTWKEPDEVLELVRLGVATRPGYPRERLEPVLAALRRPERVEFFPIRSVWISSSDVRAEVARGKRVDHLVAAAVARLIVERGLYH